MKFIIGEKQNMTQVWNGDDVVAVTAVKTGPCYIARIKSSEGKDKYNAVQLAYGKKKEKNLKKPQLAFFKKLNLSPKHVQEFRITEELKDIKAGDEISIESFNEGDKVKVTGKSKGRGFQGVVKRHGFSGTKATHGNKDQLRMPGSIGSTGPAHVFKGMRMPGRMGNDRVSLVNLEIIKVDTENNLLYIKGAIPGHRNSLIYISAEGELKITEKKEELKSDIKDTENKETAETEEKKEEAKEDPKQEENKKEEVKEEDKKDNSKEEKTAEKAESQAK
ncbi:50S ribosomal protein L3 [Patescibacteria group bacterium]|nr:50S ribosomal protein L3 [Patescibacteria group bacterium]